MITVSGKFENIAKYYLSLKTLFISGILQAVFISLKIIFLVKLLLKIKTELFSNILRIVSCLCTLIYSNENININFFQLLITFIVQFLCFYFYPFFFSFPSFPSLPFFSFLFNTLEDQMSVISIDKKLETLNIFYRFACFFFIKIKCNFSFFFEIIKFIYLY